MSEKKIFTMEQAKEIGENLGINWSKFNTEQFRMGLDVELEHGKISPNTNVSDNDPLVTAKIALAHLEEFPDYYTRLEKMENKAEKYWDNHNLLNDKQESDVNSKNIYTGDNDEEVLNCEGKPCNFVYDDVKGQEKED